MATLEAALRAAILALRGLATLATAAANAAEAALEVMRGHKSVGSASTNPWDLPLSPEAQIPRK